MTGLLFGDPSPSLRWRAAVELDGGTEGDDDVRAWREEIDHSGEIGALVARLDQSRDNPQATAYLLCRLAYLGYRGPALDDAVEGVFAHQQADGSWPVWNNDDEPPRKRRRGEAPASLPRSESYRVLTMQTVLPLRGVAAVGFATDPRAERGYDWLVGQRLFDGSWTGSHKADLGLDGRSSGEDPDYRKLKPGEGCRAATTGAVACLALHPDRRGSDAALIGVEHLLRQDLWRAASIGWEVSRLVGLVRASGRFTFYVTHDLAFVLDLASRCGLSAEHPHVAEIVDYLESRRGPFGLWEHPEHPQLSRWLTLDIEASLRRMNQHEVVTPRH